MPQLGCCLRISIDLDTISQPLPFSDNMLSPCHGPLLPSRLEWDRLQPEAFDIYNISCWLLEDPPADTGGDYRRSMRSSEE